MEYATPLPRALAPYQATSLSTLVQIKRRTKCRLLLISLLKICQGSDRTAPACGINPHLMNSPDPGAHQLSACRLVGLIDGSAAGAFFGTAGALLIRQLWCNCTDLRLILGSKYVQPFSEDVLILSYQWMGIVANSLASILQYDLPIIDDPCTNPTYKVRLDWSCTLMQGSEGPGLISPGCSSGNCFCCPASSKQRPSSR